MDTTRRALLAGLLTLLVGADGPSAQEPVGRVDPVVLIVAFADGRAVHHVVTNSRGSSWTPLFPRLPGAQPAGEPLPITALKHTHVLRGDGAVSVAVSVLRGSAREREDAIAAVDVRPGERVTIDALRNVGVAPLVLSLTALTPTMLDVPAVLNRTAGLEVTDVQVVAEPGPGYRLTVRNLSVHPAIAFRVLTYRGDRLALSGLQGNLHQRLMHAARFRSAPPAALAATDAAMPLYRSALWEHDDRANRFWIAIAAPMLALAGGELSEAHAKAYGTPWPTRILVDVTSHACDCRRDVRGDWRGPHAALCRASSDRHRDVSVEEVTVVRTPVSGGTTTSIPGWAGRTVARCRTGRSRNPAD